MCRRKKAHQSGLRRDNDVLCSSRILIARSLPAIQDWGKGLLKLARSVFNMLELREISKIYGKTQALCPTSLSFPCGQTKALLGTSGCGKSTLLRLIAGLIQPDSGTIHLNGERLTAQNIQSVRQRMGYVIQEGGLFPHLSLGANISLMARHLRWPQARIERRMADLAELARLAPEFLERFPGQVSGGQRQRAALMRALFLDPELLLLDEPLGALDPIIRTELQAELREIFSTLRKTVVLVTHDLGEAAFLADAIALLDAGRIVQQGKLEQLLESPAAPFVTRFINSQRHPFERGLRP
jgi:osmoprotectant transport system ATP-binding protein